MTTRSGRHASKARLSLRGLTLADAILRTTAFGSHRLCVLSPHPPISRVVAFLAPPPPPPACPSIACHSAIRGPLADGSMPHATHWHAPLIAGMGLVSRPHSSSHLADQYWMLLPERSALGRVEVACQSVHASLGA